MVAASDAQEPGRAPWGTQCPELAQVLLGAAAPKLSEFPVSFQ